VTQWDSEWTVWNEFGPMAHLYDAKIGTFCKCTIWKRRVLIELVQIDHHFAQKCPNWMGMDFFSCEKTYVTQWDSVFTVWNEFGPMGHLYDANIGTFCKCTIWKRRVFIELVQIDHHFAQKCPNWMGMDFFFMWEDLCDSMRLCLDCLERIWTDGTLIWRKYRHFF